MLAMVAMAFAYACVIAVGRQGPYAENAYYLYFFSLILTILLYAAFDWSGGRLRLLSALCGLGAFVAINASLTYTAALNVESANRDTDRYFTAVRQFIAEHRQEPGFSFAVEDSHNVDVEVALLSGYPDSTKPREMRSTAAVVFSRYYDATHPRYRVRWNGESLASARQDN